MELEYILIPVNNLNLKLLGKELCTALSDGYWLLNFYMPAISLLWHYQATICNLQHLPSKLLVCALLGMTDYGFKNRKDNTSDSQRSV